MEITVNNQSVAVHPESSVATLLESLKFGASRGIAIAINEEIIPRETWPQRMLAARDRVTIISAVQGG